MEGSHGRLHMKEHETGAIRDGRAVKEIIRESRPFSTPAHPAVIFYWTLTPFFSPFIALLSLIYRYDMPGQDFLH